MLYCWQDFLGSVEWTALCTRPWVCERVLPRAHTESWSAGWWRSTCLNFDRDDQTEQCGKTPVSPTLENSSYIVHPSFFFFFSSLLGKNDILCCSNLHVHHFFLVSLNIFTDLLVIYISFSENVLFTCFAHFLICWFVFLFFFFFVLLLILSADTPLFYILPTFSPKLFMFWSLIRFLFTFMWSN